MNLYERMHSALYHLVTSARTHDRLCDKCTLATQQGEKVLEELDSLAQKKQYIVSDGHLWLIAVGCIASACVGFVYGVTA